MLKKLKTSWKFFSALKQLSDIALRLYWQLSMVITLSLWTISMPLKLSFNSWIEWNKVEFIWFINNMIITFVNTWRLWRTTYSRPFEEDITQSLMNDIIMLPDQLLWSKCRFYVNVGWVSKNVSVETVMTTSLIIYGDLMISDRLTVRSPSFFPNFA